MTKIINETCAICKDICSICKKEKSGKQVYISHHISYDKDITIRVCRPCHNWMHGRQVYGHPFKTEYGKDMAPFYFAGQVVRVYNESLELTPSFWGRNKK